MLPKILIGILIFFLVSLAVINFIEKQTLLKSGLKFGVTYSPRYARYLDLDWKKTYLQILDELEVRNLRLPTYWDILEKEEGIYDFSETDFLLSEAEKRGAKVILVVGARQPRWPECHVPSWAKIISLDERQQKTLELIDQVVKRYKDNKSIWAYQVENEPFAFWFGESCDRADRKFLQTEVDLVKKLDNDKKIVITDSGEIGFWLDSITFGDILGSSVYRKSYNSLINSYLSYPYPALMYSMKASLAKKLNPGKQVINSELQAEVWLSGKDLSERLPKRQAEVFSQADFKSNVEFAKKIGFEENYLWGVEWWYFMEKMGYPQYLEYAKTLF